MTHEPTRFEPLAGILAIMLPGAGHLFLGEAKRGILIGAGVLGLFVGGVLIGGLDVVDSKEDRLWFVGQAMVGPIAFGTDTLHQRLRGIEEDGDVSRVTRSLSKPNEIGTLYATIAGMMNLIAILDAMFPPVSRGRSERKDKPAKGGAS